MPDTLQQIEDDLRTLASKFSGVWLGQQVPKDYTGPVRTLGVTVVNEDGEDEDVSEILLALADRVFLVARGSQE